MFRYPDNKLLRQFYYWVDRQTPEGYGLRLQLWFLLRCLSRGQFRRFIASVQELYRDGFTEVDTWNLKSVLANFMVPRLKMFRRETQRYGTPLDLTMTQWLVALDSMIYAFANHDDFSWNHEEAKKKQQKIQEGLDLFAKYFQDLWT